MAQRFLRDAQLEVPYLESRWMLGEPSTFNYVFDDVGGIVLPAVGSPTLGLPPLVQDDPFTSARGGYTAQLDGFQASVAGFAFGSGVTVEGVTVQELIHGTSFYLFNAPGQAQLEVIGSGIAWSMWTGAQHTLTAASVLTGPPQIIQGTYDPTAQVQAIYVDGVLVASQVLSGTVAASTTGNTQLLVAAAASNTIALGQDIAVYNGALSQGRITQHFSAFMQIWSDPGHAQFYPYIAVKN
jgi:hypothetical protein